jgi:hypothetical protein
MNNMSVAAIAVFVAHETWKWLNIIIFHFVSVDTKASCKTIWNKNFSQFFLIQSNVESIRKKNLHDK